MEIPDEWLELQNQRMGEEGVPYAGRPFKAIETWTVENRCSVSFPSPNADRVFSWFESHSPKGAHAIGAMFTGAFYFDAYFWKVSIPIAFGMVNIDALDCLEGMPRSVRNLLELNPPHLTDYCALWVDLLDYAYGFDEIRRHGKTPAFAARLATSAHNELNTTVRLLTETPQRHNPKAIESARMAAEMYLKAYLAAHATLDEAGAKKLSHNLERTVDECGAASKGNDFEHIKRSLAVFPSIESRYAGTEYPPLRLWNAYCIAQFLGTTLVRSLTDRDSRGQMFPKREGR